MAHFCSIYRCARATLLTWKRKLNFYGFYASIGNNLISLCYVIIRKSQSSPVAKMVRDGRMWHRRNKTLNFNVENFPTLVMFCWKLKHAGILQMFFHQRWPGRGGGEKTTSTIVIRILAVRLLCKEAISFTVTLK